MNHGLTLHSDGTLTITLPKDAEVSRVVVNGAEYVRTEPKDADRGFVTCMNPEKTHVRTMGDCIRRAAAIEALKTDCSWDIFDEYGNVTERGQDIIEAIGRVPSAEPLLDWQKIVLTYLLPSVQPERKKGKWKLRTDERFDIDYYKCSECGYEPYRKMDISNFCPNCGADMRGDSDG